MASSTTRMAAQPEMSKQLRVEDALAYLDRVKTQFADQPHIYNKFLEIMKAFKAQDINTPGVIKRVSDLFKGHTNLILGFNTFLPPGYRIEVVPTGVGGEMQTQITTPSGTMLASRAGGGPAPSAAPAPAAPSASAAPAGGSSGGGSARPAPAASSAAAPRASGSSSSSSSSAGASGGASGSSSGGAPPVRTGPATAVALDFDHAINYVTKIKKRFINDPGTYRSFLEILHTYQKQHRNIKDVLERVSVLFKDHPDLLRDFTYFLPDAVQETAKERLSRAAEQARARAAEAEKAAGAAGRRGGSGASGAYAGGGGGGSYGAGYRGPPAFRGGFEAGTGPVGRGSGAVGPGAAMGRDRDRLREADRDSEREGAARQERDALLGREAAESERERERLIDRHRDRSQVGMGPGKSPRLAVAARRRRGREEELHLTLTPTERTFFARLKGVLGGREAWVEALKCFDLYSAEVISRSELLALLADVFGPAHAGLLDDVKMLLTARGALEMTPEDVWYSMPIGEIDLSQAPRCTPSYRALPDGYPQLACSERSRLEREVCNDRWVSVPTGSEDFSFKIMRKNSYEDALFRCEDERFEIDMVIENNASAIRALEPLAEEIAALKAFSTGVDWQFRLDRRSLSVLHLKAVARVYGEYGNEVLELLRKNPAVAIPTVLARLKQKDEEWRRARLELNKGWKEVMEKNYYKSLDHRSFYFKQHDKKHLQPKSLLAEMRDKVERLEATVREYLTALEESVAEAERAAAVAAAGERAAAADAARETATRDAAAAREREAKAKADAEAAAVAAKAREAAAAAAAAAGGAMQVDGAALAGVGEAAAAAVAAGGAPGALAADAMHVDAAGNVTAALTPAGAAAEAAAAGAAKPEPAAAGAASASAAPVIIAAPLGDAAAVAREPALLLPSAVKAKLRSHTPQLTYLYRDTRMHRDAAMLLAFAVEKQASSSDKGLIADLWRTLLTRFFQFPREYLRSGALAGYLNGYGTDTALPEGLAAAGAGAGGILDVGHVVKTPYGLGVVEAVRLGPYTSAGHRGHASTAVGTAQAMFSGASALAGPSAPSSSSAAAAAGAAEGVAPPSVTYSVTFGWGTGILAADCVTSAERDMGRVLAPTLGILSGGAQPFSAASGAATGRVKPIATAATAAGAAEAAAAAAPTFEGSLARTIAGAGIGAPSGAAGAADDAAAGGAAAGAAGSAAALVNTAHASAGAAAGNYSLELVESLGGVNYYASQQAQQQPQPAGAPAGAGAGSSSSASSSSAMQTDDAAAPATGASAGSGSGGGYPAPPPECVLYTTAAGYVFFRLHQMLVDRLQTARVLCARRATQAGPGFGKPIVTHPVDRAFSALAAQGGAGAAGAPGVAAAVRGHAANEMRSVAAAAVGDLTSAAAAGAGVSGEDNATGSSGTSGSGSSGGDAMQVDASAAVPAAAAAPQLHPAAAAAAVAEQTYQHFLTALCGLIEGTLDSSKYEDECRELMGTGAYLLFTLDRLIASAMKQLVTLVHDPSSVRLRSMWEYVQARIALARGTLPPAEAEAAVRAAVSTYKQNVGTALLARGGDDVFCVQYWPLPPDMSASEDLLAAAGVDVSSPVPGSAAASAAAHGGPLHQVATLTIRYIGKPLYEASNRTVVRGFQYAAALPSFLAREVGQGRVILGDESVEEIEAEMAADEVAKASAAAAAAGVETGAAAGSGATRRVRFPYLVRTLGRREGYSRVLNAATIGPGAKAAARLAGVAQQPAAGAGAAAPGQVVGNVAARVLEGGKLQYIGGAEEALVRR